MSIDKAIIDASRLAMASGSLEPIHTRVERCQEGGIDWIVRVVERLADKPVASAGGVRTSAPVSPWLPPEPELLVARLDGHIVVLNKFPVIDNHALIVSRDYQEQESPLTLADFEALQTAVHGWPAPGALGFYNSGVMAGASQRHKHLQLVPLPLAAGDEAPLPLNPLHDSPGFAHAVTSLEGGEDAGHWLAHYQELRVDLRLRADAPYNLLITREWMMLVPRSCEHFRTISVNSLGFAGCLLARTDDELKVIREAGPTAILGAVT